MTPRGATIEMATRGTYSVYPLLRARELDGSSVLEDGRDEVIQALAHDADDALDRREALRRIAAMNTMDLHDPSPWGATLQHELREVLGGEGGSP